MSVSAFDDQEQIRIAIANGRHRDLIGGLWNEIGSLQFHFMLAQGLTPEMVLIDVGSGCFRGGVHFVQYLEAGNYYCLEMNRALIDVGFEKELKPLGLAEKVPQKNCLCNEDFDFSDLGVTKVDMAVAVSLFTHITFNQIRHCLERLAAVMKMGGTFYASFFECVPNRATMESLCHEPGGVISYGTRDPYHYRFEDFVHAAKWLPWAVSYIGDWSHPRDQKMARFTKI